jgi:ribosomal protein RSM22 (predicted rRNA methylase)
MIGTKLARAYAAVCPVLAEADVRVLTRGSGFDPQETLDVRCGNGFDVGFSLYQSARLSRYNADP